MKCRGCGNDCGNDTDYNSPSVGWMHLNCEVKRLNGLLTEEQSEVKGLQVANDGQKKVIVGQMNTIQRLQGIVNQAGIIERKKNRDVLRALRQMSGNPDEHYIPPVTLAKRTREAEDAVQELTVKIDRLQGIVAKLHVNAKAAVAAKEE